MRVRVTSDGTVVGTVVQHGETGTTLAAREFSFHAGADQRHPTLRLTLCAPFAMEVQGEVDLVIASAKRWAEVTGYEVCEGCYGPAEGHDDDGIPLCDPCGLALDEEDG